MHRAMSYFHAILLILRYSAKNNMHVGGTCLIYMYLELYEYIPSYMHTTILMLQYLTV